MPADVLSAVTFTPDFKRMYVQVTSRAEAKRVWVNGDEVKAFRLLHRAMPSEPDVLAFDPPQPVHAGMPLYVKVELSNGRIRQELLRAMAGISLDTFVRLPAAERTEYSLDENPPVVMLEGDPTCSDTYGRRRGSSAPHMVSDRLHLFAKEKDKLAGLAYCTAIYPELWNIYGPIADAVYAKPYQLGWGYRKMKFLEEEEDAMRSTALTAAPRPMFWIPQRLKPHEGRHLEAAELETLGWVSLVRGGKGIRYHHWRPENEQDGFKDCPWLKSAIRELNRAVRSREQMLSALVLESEQKLEDKVGGWSKVYTSWAGEAGVLVMVRNLNYEADAMPPAGSTGSYFRVRMRKTVEVPLVLPTWLKGRVPVDFLSGENLPFEIEKGVMQVTLPELGSYRLIWLADHEL